MIVTVDVPVAAVALAVSVRELVVVAEAGLKDAVTPLGRPDADKLTVPLKPFEQSRPAADASREVSGAVVVNS